MIAWGAVNYAVGGPTTINCDKFITRSETTIKHNILEPDIYC